MQAVVLAGGRGARLSEAVPDRPKSLAPIGDRPFLLYLLEHLKSYGVDEAILAVGYRAEQIEEAFGDGSGLGISLRYARETSPLGTGGALRNALPLIRDDDLLVVNGDTFFDLNYGTLKKFHRAWGAWATVALKYRPAVSRYGLTELGPDYRVAAFREKPGDDGGGYVNGGVYLLRRQMLETFPEGYRSLEREILPQWVRRGTVFGLPFGGKFIDIGVPEDYRLACDKLPGWVESPKYRGLFLDRDGVIIEDSGYVYRKEDVRFNERVVRVIRSANRLGWKVIVVTNQAGVARGLYSEDDVRRLHQWLGEALKKKDAHIEAFYYCPHHPEGTVNGYRKACLCRKPSPGMVLTAADEIGIELEKSRMIGDKGTDLIRLPYLKSRILQL